MAQVRRLGIRSIAIPTLGCGNGRLQWADVRPLIEAAFEPLREVEVRLFEPEDDARALAGRPHARSALNDAHAPEEADRRA